MLRLMCPLVTSQGVVAAREIIILAVHTDQGAGIGEAAPLPEHGTESFADSWDAALYLAMQRALPPAESGDQWLDAVLPARTKTPALAFALASALAGAAPAADNCFAADLFADGGAVTVNALIGGLHADALLAAVERAVAEGFETVKVKAGVSNVDTEIAAIENIRNRFPALHVRVDANEAWSLPQAQRFFEAAKSLSLEFVEDPLYIPTAESLSALRECGVPIALDASLRVFSNPDDVLRRGLCDVLIMKPPRWGSLAALRSTLETAAAANIDVVFSSSMESSAGLTCTAALAARFGSNKLAHGLATAPLLTDDTLTVSLLPDRGRVPIRNIRELPSLLRDDMRGELQLET